MLIQKTNKPNKEAVGCIITFNEKFLLLHRTKDNLWGSVAGDIEIKESKEQAIRREINQELGLNITPKYFTTTHHVYGNEKIAYRIFYYKLKKDISNSIKLNSESFKFGFFSLEETKKLKLYEDEYHCLKLFSMKTKKLL